MPSSRVSSVAEYIQFAQEWQNASQPWMSFNEHPQVRAKKAFFYKQKQGYYRGIANNILAMVDALFPKDPEGEQSRTSIPEEPEVAEKQETIRKQEASRTPIVLYVTRYLPLSQLIDFFD
jgi:hypothetical protein